VIASQTNYLVGGLVVVETLFHWNGVGVLIYNAATHNDFTMLEAGVLVIGATYMVVTLFADILYSLLNPRIRFQGTE
jgi:peptide/nickel transport system permease protein